MLDKLAHRGLHTIICAFTLFAASGAARAANLCMPDIDGKTFVVSTSRVRVTVRAGVIVGIRNLVTGEVQANEALTDIKIPRGLGHLDGNPPGAGQLSSAARPPSQEYRYYHHPNIDSHPTIVSNASTCTASWTGLEYGRLCQGTEMDCTKDSDCGAGVCNAAHPFPYEMLTLNFQIGSPGGELLFSASVTTPNTPGVSGAVVPIVNLGNNHKIYVPSFGGLMYDSSMNDLSSSNGPTLRNSDRAPYWTAPVVAIESPTSSLGLWIADPNFIPNSFMFSYTGTGPGTGTFGVGIPQYNLLPYDAHTSFTGTWWRLDAFQGNWTEAMTPYKNWYAQHFAPELALRDSTTWGNGTLANKIRVIIDRYMYPGPLPGQPGYDPNHDPYASYSFFNTQFGADKTVIQEFQARLSTFDTNLPNYTPKPDYPGRNDRLVSHGIHPMGYVNTLCVNYGSQGFCDADVLNIGLPQKYRSFYDYYLGTPHDFTNAIPPYPQAACAVPSQAAPAGPGEILFMDPLKSSWRQSHYNKMAAWHTATHFEANYEDVGGLSGDFGNGYVDGLSGSNGTIQMFRELQGLGVPMATEYNSDAVAFATLWPLRANTAWGSLTQELWRSHHHRPVETFLFGQRPWLPTAVSGNIPRYVMDNVQHHALLNMSDAMGGLGVVVGTEAAYRATRGDFGHMIFRAKQFAQKELKPFFHPAHGPATLISRYTDNLLNYYDYYDDGLEQKLVGPNGTLYSRFTGVTSKTTSLDLAGWPMVNNGVIGGLEPAARYNLSGTPGTTNIKISTLSSGVKIAKYYETPTHVVVMLDKLSGQSTPSATALSLYTTIPCYAMIVNDSVGVAPAWNPSLGRSALKSWLGIPLPAYLVFSKVPTASVIPATVGSFHPGPAPVGHFIERETGIDRGGELPPLATRYDLQTPDGTPASHLTHGGENAPHTFDYLVKVQSASEVMRIHFCGLAGDPPAVFYINGKEVCRSNAVLGCGASMNQTFSYPLGAFNGKEVLVSVAMEDGPPGLFQNFTDDGDGRYFAYPFFDNGPQSMVCPQ